MPQLKKIRHEQFCKEYCVDKNATKAGIRAGFSPRSARTTGSRLMQKEDIKARVAELMVEISQKIEITAASVLNELKKLGFSNMMDFHTVGADGKLTIDLTDMTRDQAAALQTVKTTETATKDVDGNTVVVRSTDIKLADKRAALVDLGKHLGIFTETHVVATVDASELDGIPLAEKAKIIAYALAKAANEPDPNA